MAGRGFPRANRVQTSIWDTRITDANQTTGDNFFGAVGGPADLFLIRDINGERQLEAIQSGFRRLRRFQWRRVIRPPHQR